MIRHHPDQALLLDHASGAADSMMSLLVATHMAFCADCRATVAALEKAGGALLEDLPPAAMGQGALAATLARLDAPISPAPAATQDGTPGPLRRFLGRDLSAVRWRRLGPNLAYRTLVRRGGTALRLLRGVPGADVGAHSHRGLEYTLVLRGGFSDVTGSYGPGDLQCADGSLRHNPIADPGEDCINLAVTTAPLRFENLLQKIAAPLFGF